MKLEKASYQIWEQEPGLEGIYKQIEKVGRVSYHSGGNIKEGSAKSFVDRMVDFGHGAVLEHGTVYLTIPFSYTYSNNENEIPDKIIGYLENPYSKCEIFDDVSEGFYPNKAYITTNYRVLVENHWLEDLQYLCEPTLHHHKRISVYFICDRATGESFLRHRVFSFIRESTRYCNYSKDKFNNEVTFIEPSWFEGYDYNENTYHDCFLNALKAAEASYFDLLKKWDDKIPDKRYKTGFRNNPWTPEQARTVLPFAVKSPLVMTGFVEDWIGRYEIYDKKTKELVNIINGLDWEEVEKYKKEDYRIIEKGFFPLRCSKKAHPQAQELALPLRDEFIEKFS